MRPRRAAAAHVHRQDHGRAMIELDDGRTLARVVEMSAATLVVLDADAFALSRLWCLYEIGSTPLHKLELITHGVDTAAVAKVGREVDAEKALCFSDDDRKMITKHIEDRYSSMREFTEQLRLRLLLKPLGYEADLAALRERCAGETASLGALAASLPAAEPGGGGSGGGGGGDEDDAGRVGGRAALVVGGAGEGKSTIASQAAAHELQSLE